MDTAGGAVTVPSIAAANGTTSSNVIINANQSNNNDVVGVISSGVGGHHNHSHSHNLSHSHSQSTLIHNNIISAGSNSGSLIIGNGSNGGGGGGNSSSSSSSTSSNSSGYGSTSATPTNSYETHAASTTPVAIAEPIIPVATVAAVSPFCSEAITSQVHESQHYSAHQQQQHPPHPHLQQQQLQQSSSLLQQPQHQQISSQGLQHSQRQQQYYSSYDYLQQPQQQQQTHEPAVPQEQQQHLLQEQTHNYQLSASGSGSFDATNNSSSSLGNYQQAMIHPYKATGVAAINYERHLNGRSATSSSSSRSATYPQHLPNEVTSNKPANHPQHQQQHNQQYLGITHSSSSSSSSKTRSSTSLIGSSSSSTTAKPQAAATPFYAQPLAQQQSGGATSYYEQLKHKVPLDYPDNYGISPNVAAAAAYHNQQKYYAAAKSQLKEAVPYGAPVKTLYHNSNDYYPGASAPHGASTVGYEKYMYPSTSYPAIGYQTAPADPAYRKTNAASAGSVNSPNWPWGIEYASGNSRTIPPPSTGHIPTATVAPTHASYLTANSSHLTSRDPYYMAHDKYGMKYDKYPPSYQQTAYGSPPSVRHHLWQATHNPLNERLTAQPATHAPHGPHALHSSAPYFPANAPPSALNPRQSCCTQPYPAQNCYYPPPPGRITHGQPVAAAIASGYMAPQSVSNHHQSRYGSTGNVDYGAGNKLKPPNDLYISSHYENTNAPPGPPHYQFGTSASNQYYSSNQMHHGQQPAGPLIAHDPSLTSSASFSNDLNLSANNYDPYLHETSHNLAGMPPSVGPTSAKRALLDYRKPIQPQPPPPAPAHVQIESYDPQSSAHLSNSRGQHYNDSTELLNTPETTTAFNDYEIQSQASAYTSEDISETQNKSGEDATKNLSLRDFLANWNDDEEDYTTSATNEVITFDQQAAVINDVLQNTATDNQASSSIAEMPALISDKPSASKIQPLSDADIEPPLNEADTSQYTNLPDIIIDIEKSNNVNPSITPALNDQTTVESSSISLDNFDVEKELDQLQQMQRKHEVGAAIAKSSHPEDVSRNDIKPNKLTQEADTHQTKNLTSQISFDDLNLEPTKTILPTTRTHASNDIEGYDSGSSRHSNESSLFEKEYETFINKISSTSESLTKAEKEFEQKVQDFSKFYKRKRKLKHVDVKSPEAASEQDAKKLKSSDEKEVENSNFPRVYTKKSRNRHKRPEVKLVVKSQPIRRRKPTSFYYKQIHALRRHSLQHSKDVRDYIDEVKEKHLPLIKRQSIKNYSLTSPSAGELFNPLPLKTLVLTVINSDEFRGRIMNVTIVESQTEPEEKHICVDPTCETCEVIRSLMEPADTVEDDQIEDGNPNSIVISNSAQILISPVQTSEDGEQGQIVLVREIEGDPKDLFPTAAKLPEKAEIESAIIIKEADVPTVLDNQLKYDDLNVQATKPLTTGVIIKTDVYEEQLDASTIVEQSTSVDLTQISTDLSPKITEIQGESNSQTPLSVPESSPIKTADDISELSTEISQNVETEQGHSVIKLLESDEEAESQTSRQIDSPRTMSVIRKHESNSAERDFELQSKIKCIEPEAPALQEYSPDLKIIDTINKQKVESAQKTTVICKIESNLRDKEKISQGMETSCQKLSIENVDELSIPNQPITINAKQPIVPPVTALATTVIRKHETNSKESDCIEPSKNNNPKNVSTSSLDCNLQPDDDSESSESETCSSSCSSSDSSGEDDDDDKVDDNSQDSSDSDSDSDAGSTNKTVKTFIKVVKKCEKLSKISKVLDDSVHDSFRKFDKIGEVTENAEEDFESRERCLSKRDESSKAITTDGDVDSVKSFADILGSNTKQIEIDKFDKSGNQEQCQQKEVVTCEPIRSSPLGNDINVTKLDTVLNNEDIIGEKEQVMLEDNLQLPLLSSNDLQTSASPSVNFEAHEKIPTEKIVTSNEKEQNVSPICDNISNHSKCEIEMKSRSSSVEKVIENLTSDSNTQHISDNEAFPPIAHSNPKAFNRTKILTDDEYMDTLFPQGPIKLVSNDDLELAYTHTDVCERIRPEVANLPNFPSSKRTVKNIDEEEEDLEKLSPDSPAENISDDEISTHSTNKRSLCHISGDTYSPNSAHVLSYTPEESWSPSSKTHVRTKHRQSSSPVGFSTKFVYGPKEEFIDLSEETSSSDDSEEEESSNELAEYPSVVDITEDTSSEEDSDSNEADRRSDNETKLSKIGSPEKANNISQDTWSSGGTTNDNLLPNVDEQTLPTTPTAIVIPVIASKFSESSNSGSGSRQGIETNIGSEILNERDESRSPYDINTKCKMYESVIKSVEEVQRENECEQNAISNPPTPIPHGDTSSNSNNSNFETISCQKSPKMIKSPMEFHSVIRDSTTPLFAQLTSSHNLDAVLENSVVESDNSTSQDASERTASPQSPTSILTDHQENYETTNICPNNPFKGVPVVEDANSVSQDVSERTASPQSSTSILTDHQENCEITNICQNNPLKGDSVVGDANSVRQDASERTASPQSPTSISTDHQENGDRTNISPNNPLKGVPVVNLDCDDVQTQSIIKEPTEILRNTLHCSPEVKTTKDIEEVADYISPENLQSESIQNNNTPGPDQDVSSGDSCSKLTQDELDIKRMTEAKNIIPVLDSNNANCISPESLNRESIPDEDATIPSVDSCGRLTQNELDIKSMPEAEATDFIPASDSNNANCIAPENLHRDSIQNNNIPHLDEDEPIPSGDSRGNLTQDDIPVLDSNNANCISPESLHRDSIPDEDEPIPSGDLCGKLTQDELDIKSMPEAKNIIPVLDSNNDNCISPESLHRDSIPDEDEPILPVVSCGKVTEDKLDIKSMPEAKDHIPALDSNNTNCVSPENLHRDYIQNNNIPHPDEDESIKSIPDSEEFISPLDLNKERSQDDEIMDVADDASDSIVPEEEENVSTQTKEDNPIVTTSLDPRNCDDRFGEETDIYDCQSEYSITSPDFYDESSTSSEDTRTEESADLEEFKEHSCKEEQNPKLQILNEDEEISKHFEYPKDKETSNCNISHVKEDEHVSKEAEEEKVEKEDGSHMGFHEAQTDPCTSLSSQNNLDNINESPNKVSKFSSKEDSCEDETEDAKVNKCKGECFESEMSSTSQCLRGEEPVSKFSSMKDSCEDKTKDEEVNKCKGDSFESEMSSTSQCLRGEEPASLQNLPGKKISELSLEPSNKDIIYCPEIEESAASPKEEGSKNSAQENITVPNFSEPSLERSNKDFLHCPEIEESPASPRENDPKNSVIAFEDTNLENLSAPEETPLSVYESSPTCALDAVEKVLTSPSLNTSEHETTSASLNRNSQESHNTEEPCISYKGNPAEVATESPKANDPEDSIRESPEESSTEMPKSDLMQSPTNSDSTELKVKTTHNDLEGLVSIPDSKSFDNLLPIEELLKVEETITANKISEKPDTELLPAESSSRTDVLIPDNITSSSPDHTEIKEYSDHSVGSISGRENVDQNSNSCNEGLDKSTTVRSRSRETSPEMNFWNTKGKYRALRTYKSDAPKSPTNVIKCEESRENSSRISSPDLSECTSRSETTPLDSAQTTDQSLGTNIVTSTLKTSKLPSSKRGDDIPNSTTIASDFTGFKVQTSFDEGSDFNGFEDQHEEERIRREVENLNEDSAANDAFLYAMVHKSPSKSPELDELEALEKELSQQCLVKDLSDEESEIRQKNALELDTETQAVSVSNVIISTTDIEHIKKMLESDEEHPNDDETDLLNTAKVGRREVSEGANSRNLVENISSTNVCPIPKLSDLCRAALNSSLNVNKLQIVQSNHKLDEEEEDHVIAESQNSTTTTDPNTTTPLKNEEQMNKSSPAAVERELSVEEALAEMYRQAGVLLSDPEDNDSEKATTPTPTVTATAATNAEAQDVLLINLHEILNSDNDVFVLQCDMNVTSNNNGDSNDTGNSVTNAASGNSTLTERVHNLQLIGIVNRDNESSEIHIISSDSESEVIILSDCDTDVEFQPPAPPRSFSPRPPPRDYIPFITDLEDTSDSLSDLSTIHHEEIVPDNLNKFLQEEFYKYLHEKYAQKKLSKYYHANRVLRKYKKSRVIHKYRP